MPWPKLHCNIHQVYTEVGNSQLQLYKAKNFDKQDHVMEIPCLSYVCYSVKYLLKPDQIDIREVLIFFLLCSFC